MFSCTAKTSFTPKRRAVSGISCIRPLAPLGDTARGLKPDSTAITAASSDSGSAWRCAAARISPDSGAAAGGGSAASLRAAAAAGSAGAASRSSGASLLAWLLSTSVPCASLPT